MKHQYGYTSFEIFVCAMVLFGCGGWIANIVKLFSMLDGGISAMFIARIVGAFAFPLGAILGYL